MSTMTARQFIPLCALLVATAGLAGCLGGEGPTGSRLVYENTTNVSDGSNESAPPPSSSAPSGSNGSASEPDNGTDEQQGPAPGTVIDEDHIAVGSPTTSDAPPGRSLAALLGVEGVESFAFELPEAIPAGTPLVTNTTDGAGLGYELDLWFHTAEGEFVGGCGEDAGGEARCRVPEGAAQGTVDAIRGADLDVRLVVVEPQGDAA